ncbi:hypothetical protein LRH25_07165 [Ideonella azotifigens]|uniref:Uncharacterized protein n=1 Tax=Ideonella azotifigens TaxID=513160 RepID=A0ABN1JPY1_9BURK|nr:hypothetical protein [Ideonella azotifigens]MCD2340121.1 hypothetical protein [Ideonella azotifigens]
MSTLPPDAEAAMALAAESAPKGSAAAVSLAASRLVMHRSQILDGMAAEQGPAQAGSRRRGPSWGRWLGRFSFLAPLLGLSRLSGLLEAEQLLQGQLRPLALRHPKTLLLASAATGSFVYLLLPRVWRFLLWPTLLAEGQMLAQRTVRDVLMGAVASATQAVSPGPASSDATEFPSPIETPLDPTPGSTS